MTKEQLSYINGLDSKEEIKNQLNEWFGIKELEAGKWYETQGNIFNFNGEYDKDGDPKGFGFLDTGRYAESNGLGWYIVDNPKLATEQEVFEALKKEAVKRGYKDGVCVNSFVHNRNLIISDSNNGKEFILKYNKLHFGSDGNNMCVIFEKGKWAEIIQTITKEEAEKQLGKIIV